MRRKVRDIIRSKMTMLMFLHSRSLAEAYFQNCCYEAYRLAEYGEYNKFHPYSFKKAQSFAMEFLSRITKERTENAKTHNKRMF